MATDIGAPARRHKLAKSRPMRIAGSIGQQVRTQPATELITIQHPLLEQR